MEVLTEELLKELMSKPSLDDVAKCEKYSSKDFADCLNDLLEQKGLKKNEVIKKTNLNETHAYQIFQGSRGASRDKVLQIAISMNLDNKQTNRLLNYAGVSSLYCKCRRDAIILYCLKNNYDLNKIDQVLYDFSEDTIS